MRSRTQLMLAVLVLAAPTAFAQQMVTETRDPKQQQDDDFAKAYAKWTTEPRFGSPLVDHLPRVAGVPTPKEVLGYYIGAPKTLTYYADILRYYRALAAATPRVKVESIGKSDEGRELVVVWVSSEENIRNLAQNRANLARLADPRSVSAAEVQQAHRDHSAQLSPHGRPAQRRDRTLRDADGAGLSSRDRDLAAHYPDPEQRDRLGDARRGARWPRPERGLVLPEPRVGSRAAAAGSPSGAGGQRPPWSAGG